MADFTPNVPNIDRLVYTRGGEVERAVTDEADGIVERAKVLAPKRTGALAAGIHHEIDVDDQGLIAKVSYDARQFWGKFQELGTEKMSPHPFLRPSLDG